jgi:hypothetical protein
VYSNLASRYEFSLIFVSIGCLLSIGGGIFFSFVVGALLDKYQAYKKFQIFICISALIGTSYHTFSLPTGNPYWELPGMFLTGTTTIPINSVAFPFAIEATFPIQEAVTNGMMITCLLIWSTL